MSSNINTRGMALGLDRIVVPEKVKCQACKKIRPNQAYSNKQLQDLRHHLYITGPLSLASAGVVKCRTCVGGQTSELTCIICDLTKGLDDFAKTQRRTPDEARCKACVDKVLNTEPTVEGQAVLNDSTYETTKEHTSMADFSRLSFNDENGRASKEAREDNESDKVGQIWLPQLRRGAAATPASGNQSGPPNRAASETETASERAKWNITPSVAGSERAPRSQAGNQTLTRGNNSNFAKVPGRRVPLGQQVGVHAPIPSRAIKDITHPEPRPSNTIANDDDEEEDVEDWL